jgi:DNA-binding GntR family transcriptional regulator
MLVETIPRRGTYVRSFSTQELLDVFDIRLRLEPLGARGAAEHATDEDFEDLRSLTDRYRASIEAGAVDRLQHEDFDFHLLIMRMSGNTFLSNIVASSNIILIANVQGLIKAAGESLAEHVHLVDAICRRDADSAEELMYHHLFSSRAALARGVAQSPSISP